MSETGLSFELLGDSQAVRVKFDPAPGLAPVDNAVLRAALEQNGFGALRIDDDELDAVVATQNANDRPAVLTLGGHRDADAALAIGDDALTATISVMPALGRGATPDRAAIDQLLADHGVTTGIDSSAIDELVARVDAARGTGETIEMVVARGTAPEPGTDAEFECLIPDCRNRTPRVLENDAVDYRELGRIFSVSHGQELMRRVPPTPGKDGMTVTGTALVAPTGINIDFDIDPASTAASEFDRNILVARISGQPVRLPHGFHIEPVVTVETVDLSTGNIDFDGSVLVLQDVEPGMVVKATGDICVKGTVEAAHLDAGGLIAVAGGIIGHGTVRDDAEDLREQAATVRCAGTVAARFVENAMIDAGDSVHVNELIALSEVTTRNHVVVGGDGKDGHIIGSTVRATGNITVTILGSPTCGPFEVEAGYDHGIDTALREKDEQLKQVEMRMKETMQMLNFQVRHPDPAMRIAVQELRADLRQYREQRAAILAERTAIEEDRTRIAQAHVAVGKKAWPGVRVRIGSKVMNLVDDTGPGSFALDDGEIRFS